jgi:hypothetical protein
MQHKEYTHLVICPDDLVLNLEGINVLIDDIKASNYPALSGIANIDESNMVTKCCQPAGIPYDSDSPPCDQWYKENTLPDEDIFEVGHSGFACQFVSRTLMEEVSFTGIKDGGFMDWKFSKECHEMKTPIMVDKRAEFYHMRTAQYAELHEWLDAPHRWDEGTTVYRRFY